MAKKKVKEKKIVVKQDNPDNFVLRHPLLSTAVVAIAVLLVLFAPYIIGGKTVQSPDRMTTVAQRPFFDKAAQEGEFPLWTPYIFSGMPSYGSMLGIPGQVNIIDYPVRSLLKALDNILPNSDFTFLFLNYLLFALLMYAMMRQLNVAPLASSLSALAVIFIPQYVAFTAYSHNTKFLSLVLIPLVFLFARRLLQERNLLYFSLTALTVGFQFFRAHVQVVYYTFLMLGIYFIFEAVASWRENKKVTPILSSAGMLAGALAAGVVLSAVIYVSVLDYQHYSIRGGGASGGLDFNYASSWSFHPLEMVTFVIPSFMGFGGQTYWGKMPFTDYPLYFSIIVFYLAGVAFVLKRNKMTWFFGFVALFALVVSFGRHVPLLYTPMFKLLPYFNKFRIPSMIHILLDFSMVVLAGFGLQALFEFRDKLLDSKNPDTMMQGLKRYTRIFVAVVGLLVLFMLIGKSVYTELVAASRSHLSAALREAAYNAAVLDSLKTISFLLLAVFVIWQFLKGKTTRLVTVLITTALVVVDLLLVDFKVVKPGEPDQEQVHFVETKAVQYLKQDTGLYRIFPVLDDKSGNWYMYHFIQNINGYSAAKLRIYQEFLEETGFATQDQYGLNPFIAKYWRYAVRQNKPTWLPVPVQQIDPKLLSFHNAMLDMLNVKYLVHSYLPINDPRYVQVQTEQPWVYQNTGVLPRAWFVDTLEVVAGKANVFSRMKDGTFDPAKTALIEEEPPFAIAKGDSNSVTVTSFGNHRIQLEASVAEPSLMVLSEIYYPAGWKAFVDGVETKIYKTNYILRSIFLQPGEHKIEFVFQPASFKIGLWISLVVLAMLLILLALGLIKYFRQRPGLLPWPVRKSGDK